MHEDEDNITKATVPMAMAGKRLDQALALMFPDYSRSRLQQWLKAKRITVNGQACRAREPVFGGEQVVVNAVAEDEGEWLAQDIPLDIVYEDKDILVINKPAGLVVHPAAGNPDGTVLNAVLHHAPHCRQVPRAGIVHRLDKDTSGLMVVACNLSSQKSLVEQLQNRSLSREYQCIVNGVMTAGNTIDAPIGRHPVDRKRMAVVAGGKAAITHYRVIQRFRAHTHVRVKLETGRTHQIRVHMAYQHYPLVGDPVYGGRLKIPAGIGPELQQALRAFPRQALHASKLGLIHPSSGEAISWEIPLPEDMQQLLQLLQGDLQQSGAE
jgi:23S rRNA pseudouridine1911/1915/1917 synthase